MPAEAARDAVYERWFALYHALATVDLAREDVRHSPEFLAQLKAAGWPSDAGAVDSYWHRVSWAADRSRGRVLEIGAGMGNVTRWIAANDAVELVLALDLQSSYVEALARLGFPKVVARRADVTVAREELLAHGPFDTVVLGEVIEHLSVDEETAIIEAVRPHLAPNAGWIISTPIGFMPDPDHRRGLGSRLFRVHARLLYGPVVDAGRNLGQQYVLCRAVRPGRLAWRGRVAAASVLGWLLGPGPGQAPVARHAARALVRARARLR